MKTEQPIHETRVEQTCPNENVGNLTLEQLGQFITRTVDEALKRNQESIFVEEQAVRQEREENVEVHQSRVEETQPPQSGEISETREMWKEIRRLREQQEAETLREFVQRFNSAALEIPAATPDIMISAFTQGLRGGEYFKSLVKKPPSSYDDLLARAEKYINLEDAQRYRRMENRPGGSRVEGAERGGKKRGASEREEDRTRSRGQFSSHVPLNRSRDKVMEVRESGERDEKSQRVENSARPPPRGRPEVSLSRSELRSRPSSRRGGGPPWIHQRIEEPRREGRGQDVPREPAEPRRGTNKDNHPTRGMIHMISGGATDGDSGRARKAHGRRLENFEISWGADLPQDPVISFGPDDLRGIVAPHNDALVVTATVANYNVTRIFIDNGSSVNILFKSTLDQMKVEGFEFEPISTLYGFAGWHRRLVRSSFLYLWDMSLGG
ncbi:uncharacterized protein [Primulina eburnea]|uniref:uncharacterized protein n=1 Tax=Primulina eburnea TaxID=1245227 RepID=UPI003C6BDF83